MSFWIKSRKSRKHTNVKKKELNELSFKLILWEIFIYVLKIHAYPL